MSDERPTVLIEDRPPPRWAGAVIALIIVALLTLGGMIWASRSRILARMEVDRLERDEEWQEASQRLTELGPVAVPYLEAALDDDATEVRVRALDTLFTLAHRGVEGGRIPPEVARALLSALDHSREDVRRIATREAGKLGLDAETDEAIRARLRELVPVSAADGEP